MNRPTISRETQQAREDIERQTREFLARGGQIQRLPSDQVRSTRKPCFNQNFQQPFENDRGAA